MAYSKDSQFVGALFSYLFYLMENLVPLQLFMVIALDVTSKACEWPLLKT
jgi:hypothetical protein